MDRLTATQRSKKHRLEDVVRFAGGGTPSKRRAEFWSGNIPWVSPKDMKSAVVTTSQDKITQIAIDSSATKWIPENATLIVVRSGILARTVPICLAGCDLTVNQDLKALIPGKTVHPRYLMLFLKSREADLLASVTNSATVHRLSTATLKSLEIALPPLDEQKRIVAVLDQAFAALDRARANAEANLSDAQELFGAALRSVVTRLSHRQQKKQRLGSIVTRLTNGYVGPTRNIYVDEGVPYLLARHVRNNALAFDGRTYISAVFNEKHKKSKLKAGDVLLVQSGHIGHSAVVPEEHAGHNCHAMIVISPINEVVSGSYLSMMFNTPVMQGTFQNIRTGSTVPHLTCKMVKELMIDVPPRDAQDEIMAQADRLRAQMSVATKRYDADLSDIAALRQSILQKAFAGQLI